MTSQVKPVPARWRWGAETGNSGLHRRPSAGAAPWGALPGASSVDHDAITTPVPAVALLQAARAMNEPDPPADLGLYWAEAEPGQAGEAEGDEAPCSSRRSRPGPAPATGSLAAEFGLDHLIDEDARPFRPRSGWLRAYGPWLVAAAFLLWLCVSFLMRWLAAGR